MYVPAHFEEKRPEVLRALLDAHPFATLITLGDEGLNANHIPFEFDPEPAPFGTLRCHVARNNQVWRQLQQGAGGPRPLVVFQGQHAYVSPSLYPSKAETHKVVPTYNYMVVHVEGEARVIEDPVWLRAMVGRLTQRFEAERTQPWSVKDAPADYLAAMLNAIVGIEISVTTMTGKWKISQNRASADQKGVLAEMQATGADDLARAMLSPPP